MADCNWALLVQKDLSLRLEPKTHVSANNAPVDGVAFRVEVRNFAPRKQVARAQLEVFKVALRADNAPACRGTCPTWAAVSMNLARTRTISSARCVPTQLPTAHALPGAAVHPCSHDLEACRRVRQRSWPLMRSRPKRVPEQRRFGAACALQRWSGSRRCDIPTPAGQILKSNIWIFWGMKQHTPAHRAQLPPWLRTACVEQTAFAQAHRQKMKAADTALRQCSVLAAQCTAPHVSWLRLSNASARGQVLGAVCRSHRRRSFAAG